MATQARRHPLETFQPGSGEGTSTARAEARDDVYAVIDEWAEAMRAKDADTAIACYGTEVRMFTLAPPLLESGGREAVDALKAWFSTWHGDFGYELTDLQVTAGEDVAFAHGLAHMTGTRTDSERVDLWFRETLCFRRIADEWKITHEHSSVPFYMDGSNRAATDLEPGSPSANAGANFLQIDPDHQGTTQTSPT